LDLTSVSGSRLRASVYADAASSDCPWTASLKSWTSASRTGLRLRPVCRLARNREPETEVKSKPETVVTLQRARSIIARNDSPDLPFTQSINPYQGCEHGCIYCYARPSHAYLGLSPGLDFETRIFAKEMPRAAAKGIVPPRLPLRTHRPRSQYRSVSASRTKAQDHARHPRVLWEFRNPVGIVTKGSLIERDLDLLEPMAREGLVQVFLSIGTLDGEIARTLEPRAAAPYRRVETVRRLSERGVPCGTLVAPVIPFLNDKDMEAVFEAVSEAGAAHGRIHAVAASLGGEGSLQGLARAELSAQGETCHGAHPRHARRTRNDPQFGSRMKGEGQYAELLRKRFEIACKRLGLNAGGRKRLDSTKFRRPDPPQRKLF